MDYRRLSASNTAGEAQELNSSVMLLSANQFPRAIGQTQAECREGEILVDIVHLDQPLASVSWVEKVSGPASVVIC